MYIKTFHVTETFRYIYIDLLFKDVYLTNTVSNTYKTQNSLYGLVGTENSSNVRQTIEGLKFNVLVQVKRVRLNGPFNLNYRYSKDPNQ